MSTVKVKYNFSYTDMHKLFVDNYERTMLLVAAVLQTQRAMIFDAEGAYNGRERWKPLKFRQGKILSDRGGLRGSIAPRNNGVTPTVGANTILDVRQNRITIGSSLIYAKIHDEGGVIKAKGKALAIPLPKGKSATATAKGLSKSRGGVLFVKSVTIPKRTFTDFNSQDERELGDTLVNFLAEVLNNG